jgi:hypothetical protein
MFYLFLYLLVNSYIFYEVLAHFFCGVFLDALFCFKVKWIFIYFMVLTNIGGTGGLAMCLSSLESQVLSFQSMELC